MAIASCAVGDELRPALGCYPDLLVARLEAQAGPAATPPGNFLVNLRGSTEPHVLWATVRGPDRGSRARTLPGVLRNWSRFSSISPRMIGLQQMEPGEVAYVFARRVPPSRYRTRAVAVGRGARLRFAVGLDPLVVGSDVEAVTFVVRARSARGEHELYRTTVTSGGSQAGAWTPYEVPLDDAADAAVVFEFETSVSRRPGSRDLVTVAREFPGIDLTPVTAIPLWGTPEIVRPEEVEGGPDIVLVSLDTLRADHLGIYGADLPTSPTIDRLARAGVVFESASTTYPTTTASHMSMLTGLYPVTHGIRSPTDEPLAAARPTLAEVLSRAGWTTGAVTENGMVATRVGFPRGFSTYRENFMPDAEASPQAAERTFDAAIDWLERHRGARFFLFVHTYDVHWPYGYPPDLDGFRAWHDGERERPIAEAPELVHARYAYAGEVRHADAQVERLMATLARLGVDQRTLVVITSDHGEEFGEHGGWFHGTTLYEEVLRVPLVLWGPRVVPADVRVATPVSLVDLMPTILDLAGVTVPAGLDGESQVPRLRRGLEDLERIVFAEVLLPPTDPRRRLVAARAATTKWIVAEEGDDPPEVYDLLNDPAERQPVRTTEALSRARVLSAAYRRRGEEPPSGPAVGPPPLDPPRELQLRALGYLE